MQTLDSYSRFSGDAAALAEAALACGPQLGLKLVADKTNERLVRYYVAEGVIDRPDRSGREALYGFRHLLQLLTARRLMEAGMTLTMAARHTGSQTTAQLQGGLAQALPTAAQMLIEEFNAVGTNRLSKVAAQRLTPAPTAKAATPALMDVLAEVRQIRDELVERMSDFQKALEVSQEVSLHEMIHPVRTELPDPAQWAHRLEEATLRFEDRLHQTLSHLDHQQKEITYRTQELHERLNMLHHLLEQLQRTPPLAPLAATKGDLV